MRNARFAFVHWGSGFYSAAAATIVLACLATLGNVPAAKALPSFARQTGQPCGTCHTDFAGLTPYGRLFKIQGYTTGGGPYRTTLFPSSNGYNSGGYIPPLLAKSLPNPAPPVANESKTWVPPISAMVTFGLTNTQAPLSTLIGSNPAPYSNNNNITIAPLSFFWGGAFTENIGAFAQVTYGGAPVAASIGTDPFVHTWAWDNTDLRYANSTEIAGIPVTYGITANNNPTVQDPWNTTPAWAFPYAVSPFTQGFGPTPIIDGAFGGHEAVSAGAYAFINNAVYLEGSAYHSLSPSTVNSLGADPFNAPGQLDWSPYWRAAYEPHWGNHWLEVGTFGMIANIHPWMASGTPLTATFPQTDTYTDIGLDTQYQYQGDNFWITTRGSYIHEDQNLNASFLNGLVGNPANQLSEARAYASLAYGNNNRVVLTGQYFTSWGTTDPILGNPGTRGWVAEIAYIPFISSQAPGWPWFNARIGLQYTWYAEFGGSTVGASANNTLFLYLWLAM